VRRGDTGAEAILARRRAANPSPALTTAICQFRALLDIERGRPAAGLLTIDGATTPVLESGPKGLGSRQLEALSLLLGGVAASRSGDLARAKEHLAKLGELYDSRDPREKWWYHLLLGELALASGDPRAAYASFTQGEPTHKLMFNDPLTVSAEAFSATGPRAHVSKETAGSIDIYREPPPRHRPQVDGGAGAAPISSSRPSGRKASTARR
jgi:hypothetical protein